MLRSFRVENHKSIREEQELSLLPAYDKSKPVVPVAAIFGGNASGKSNLLDSLRWMQGAVLHSYARWEADSGVPRVPLRLDIDASLKPSAFVVDLILDGVQHVYGFTTDDNRILEEWLYSYPRRHKRVIFERSRSSVEFGSTILSELWGLETTGDPAIFESKRKAVAGKFARVEEALGAGPFFAGARFSLVDAVFAPIFRYFDVFDQLIDLSVFAETPKVRAWRAVLAKRPSVRSAVGTDYPQLLHAFLVRHNAHVLKVAA